MTSPFKRFIGGILIGTFLSIPFLFGQDTPFGSTFLSKIQAMPPVDIDPFLTASVAFLGFLCVWVRAMAARKSQLAVTPPSTMDTLRRRRQRQRGHRLLR